MTGKIFEANAYILRKHVGEAEGETGSYDTSTILSDNSPLIFSHQTGKYFHLSWQDIINLAVQAGIDEE